MGTTRKKHPAMAVPKLNQLCLTVDELVQRLRIRIGRNGLSERMDWVPADVPSREPMLGLLCRDGRLQVELATHHSPSF
jgi:hypothetical protein